MDYKHKCTDDFIREGLSEGQGRKYEEAYECLYYLCYPKIEGMVRARKKSEDDAREIFQAAIATFYYKMTFKGVELTSTACNYLAGIAFNILRGGKDRKDKPNPKEDGYPSGFSSGEKLPEGDWEEEQYHIRLKKCLEKISGNCREILEDFYFNDMSMEEIAGKHGHKNDRVSKQTKYKCMEILRKCMDEGNKGKKNGK